MTTIQQYAAHEIAKVIGDNDNIDKINEWIRRGDGVAVYRNEDMGSPELGHQQFISFGSTAAMLEDEEPPIHMPDIGTSINWRYHLLGTYEGPRLIPHLPTPDEVDWVTPYVVCDRIVSSFLNPHGSFKERVSRWGFQVRRVSNGRDQFTEAQRLIVTIELADPKVEVMLQTWVYDEGVNSLTPVDWSIEDDTRGRRTGGDPNLGGAIVSAHNNTLGV